MKRIGRNLKRPSLAMLAALMVVGVTAGSQVDGDLAGYALPEVGTHNSVELSHGNLYPSIAEPWGMHAWSPQTRPACAGFKRGWFYDWEDVKIHAIRQTHQPSPWMGDYGFWSVLPVTGAFVAAENERGS